MTTFNIQSFETAGDFLKALQTQNSGWWPYYNFSSDTDTEWEERSWLFRGQWNADWELKPSAWRNQTDYLHNTRDIFEKGSVREAVITALQTHQAHRFQPGKI